MTNATGVIQKESDYYPFGGERQVTNTVDLNYRPGSAQRVAMTPFCVVGSSAIRRPTHAECASRVARSFVV